MKMTLGRELNREIAEKVFDCNIVDSIFDFHCGCPGEPHEDFEMMPGAIDYTPMGLKQYSSDMTAAWEVVEHFADDGYLISIGRNYYKGLGGRLVVQFKPERENLADMLFGDEAPLTICMMALKIIEDKR